MRRKTLTRIQCEVSVVALEYASNRMPFEKKNVRGNRMKKTITKTGMERPRIRIIAIIKELRIFINQNTYRTSFPFVIRFPSLHNRLDTLCCD